MLTGKILAVGYTYYNVVNKLEKKIYEPNDLFKEIVSINNISDKIKEFFKKVSFDFIKRTTPNIEDSIPETLAIKNDPLFNDIDWIKLESGKIQPPFVPNKVF
jgi:hypothetical protein